MARGGQETAAVIAGCVKYAWWRYVSGQSVGVRKQFKLYVDLLPCFAMETDNKGASPGLQREKAAVQEELAWENCPAAHRHQI
ncbi:hypothetical protein AV530_005325 [Patagioenas fasciata monilis]|uniref:Uncharacterized protein n=1 Tax=Patagioenas fasciata monilis TaxID=372326 RepID=A0A1V4JKX4_PATFA|nr:hypothetical protein AV530_005325 [Patagioenas fasciata monilis]